jgi:O-antigen ligase
MGGTAPAIVPGDLIAVAALVLWFLALLATLVAPDLGLLALVQHHKGSLALDPLIRFRLTSNNPNMLGAYLSPSLMLALGACAQGWISRRVCIWLVAGTGLVLVMTFSTGIGAALLGGSIWLWRVWRRERPLLAGLALAAGIGAGLAFIAALALTPHGHPNPYFTLALPFDGTLYPSSRLRVWIDAWQTFSANPWFGIGPGEAVAEVRFVEPDGSVHWLSEAHNVWLNIAGGSGLVGVLAFAGVVTAVWQSARSATDARYAPLRCAVLIGIGDIVLYQGIGGSFEEARFLWPLIGLSLAASVMGQAAGAQEKPRRIGAVRY